MRNGKMSGALCIYSVASSVRCFKNFLSSRDVRFFTAKCRIKICLQGVFYKTADGCFLLGQIARAFIIEYLRTRPDYRYDVISCYYWQCMVSQFIISAFVCDSTCCRCDSQWNMCSAKYL